MAGSINLDGKIRMRVETTGSDTTLGTISRLSERARYARPAFVQLADRIASYIVVALLVVAAVVATAWYFIDPERAFVITLSVLVVTCPCALALATPAAFATAGTHLAQMRLLVTNANAIEALGRATRVLFDKTGTVTRGTPVIDEVDVLDDEYDESQCRQIAAALETVSTHPLATAFAIDNNPVVADDQRVSVGEGVSGKIEGREWRLGRSDFAAGNANVPDIVLGVDGRAVARFKVSDELRKQSNAAMIKLRGLGLHLTLISGDGEAAVGNIAERLGINDFHAGCSPEDKLDIIRSVQEGGDTVIMVGDGINDAPVLAGADASIAPSHAATLAQTSADIILVGDILTPIAAGVLTARNTMRIVRQNLAWAIVYNACALPLAALGYVPPWAAAIGMSASSLIVVLNSLRISKMS